VKKKGSAPGDCNPTTAILANIAQSHGPTCGAFMEQQLMLSESMWAWMKDSVPGTTATPCNRPQSPSHQREGQQEGQVKRHWPISNHPICKYHNEAYTLCPVDQQTSCCNHRAHIRNRPAALKKNSHQPATKTHTHSTSHPPTSTAHPPRLHCTHTGTEGVGVFEVMLPWVGCSRGLLWWPDCTQHPNNPHQV
jgi:hypothetical protein